MSPGGQYGAGQIAPTSCYCLITSLHDKENFPGLCTPHFVSVEPSGLPHVRRCQDLTAYIPPIDRVCEVRSRPAGWVRPFLGDESEIAAGAGRVIGRRLPTLMWARLPQGILS